MKFKIGDKVKVKSLDWYNQNKDEYGDVWEGYTAFESIMSEYCGKYRDWETDRKSTRLNSSHSAKSRMPSSA